MAGAAGDRVRRLIRQDPGWCTCSEPLRHENDELAYCWRCQREIQATDRDGRPLGYAEDDDE